MRATVAPARMQSKIQKLVTYTHLLDGQHSVLYGERERFLCQVLREVPRSALGHGLVRLFSMNNSAHRDRVLKLPQSIQKKQ